MYRTEMGVRYKMSGVLESDGRVTGGGNSGGSPVLATAESRARSDAALYGP